MIKLTTKMSNKFYNRLDNYYDKCNAVVNETKSFCGVVSMFCFVFPIFVIALTKNKISDTINKKLEKVS